MIQQNILRKISRLVIYARDLAPLPTTKVPSEFTLPHLQHDIKCIDGWLNNQFKETRDLEQAMKNDNGISL